MGGLDFVSGYLDKYKVVSSIHKQIILFIISGTICFITDFSILLFLVEIIKMHVIVANCISVIVAIIVAYFLNVKFIFQNGKFPLVKEISLFYIFSAVSFVLDVLFMYILVKYQIMWYVTAKILVTATIALFNFSIRKWFIFVR